MAKIVMVGEHRFRLPFIDLIPFEDEQNEDLGASIKEAGEVLVRVVCWKEKATTNEDTVIDGAHRVIWAHKHGLTKVPVDRRSYASEEEASEACEELNDSRRHSPAEQVKKRRAARIERIAERRRHGESLRTIAEEEKVSVAQVKRDLESASTVPGGGTVEPADGKVVGKDKKTRPAKPKKPKATKTTDVAKDAFGNDLPKRCRDAYCDPWIQQTYDFLCLTSEQFRNERIGDGIRKRSKHYPFFNAKDIADGAAFVVQYLDDLIAHFRDNRPAGVCPACNGEGCGKHCRSSGLVPRQVYEQMKRDAK